MASRININSATRAELISLKGIGATLAERIIAHRTRIGGFKSVDDLGKVQGMSARLLEELRPAITVSDEIAVEQPDQIVVVLNPGTRKGDYIGFTVTVTGNHHVDDQPLPFAAYVPITSGAQVTVEIPNRDTLTGDVRIDVATPDGVRAARVDFPDGKLPEKTEIAVAPRAAGTTQPNEDPSAGKPNKIRGRVIDEGGRQVPADIQVVLWGAKTDIPADADFAALIVTETDSLGHFTGPYPLGAFTAAHAAISVEDEPQNVTIHLVEGEFPEFVILVVDLPEEDPLAEQGESTCPGTNDPPRSPESTDLARADGTFSSDPGAGRCVDFTKPDRTLEEFTFSYAVRTTEPSIKGFTLEEPPKIDLGKIKGLLSGAIVRRAVASEANIALADFNVLNLSSERRAAAAPSGSGSPAAASTGPSTARAAAAPALDGVEVDARLLKNLSRDPDAFSVTTLEKSVQLSRHLDLQRVLGRRIVKRPPARERLTCANTIDWDDEPTIYQACTIAHGHLLRFKQEWVADGYSMGNLLYSLPLAPGQKKQISVVDWERRESAARREQLVETEDLDAFLQRDRDISDVVRGAVNESTRGGSRSSTGSVAGGIGIGAILGPIGGFLGVGGGSSSAKSSAWQKSSRRTSASALNQLRDRTVQSASSVRSQRSSVVQTARQGERVEATTESVANYNHCHAITIQYFEVLRHLLVRQRLTDVQECLFVPLLMSRFTSEKALRWRDTMYRSVPRRLRRGFGALDRIANNYLGSDLPTGRYADEQIISLNGELRMRFQLARPRDEDDDFNEAAWNPILKLFGFSPEDFYNQHLKEKQFKDRIFLEELGPRIASAVVRFMKVEALRNDGSTANLQIDPTLISDFRNDRELYVSLRMQNDPDPVDRADIKAVIISSRLQLPGSPLIFDALPAGSRVIVESGALRYRTAHSSDHLFRNRHIRNDLTGFDDVRIETPLNRQELRNPREEDKENARNLLDYLNEHIERFHHAIWARMSEDRRYMLLDGFEAPNADGRSVASVVENELVGIVGNCLVMPVARGYHLDPTFNQDTEDPIDLLEHYEPNTPLEPSRVAMPTRGVYAEAVMGACNSCEVKDETRFWRWEESPIPDSPPPIGTTSTESRRSEPPDLDAKDFPSPIVAFQQTPAAPDPAGVSGVLQLLGQAGIFRDLAGLEGTQRNAAAALDAAFNTATTFGTKAADLALQGAMVKDVDKAMRTIQSAKSGGLIDDRQARELTEAAIRGLVGAGTTNPPKSTTNEEVEELTNTAGSNKAAVKVTRPTGEQVEVDARSTGKDDTSKPVIILTGDTGTAEHRAFNPTSGSKSLIIEVGARFRNAPEGARLRWSAPNPSALRIDNANAEKTRVRGITPGRQDLDLELLDAGGTRLASTKLKLSVPQCVRIEENAAEFDSALAASQLTGQKNDIVAEMKNVVEHLLARANARVFWKLGGLNENVPAHVPASNVVVATVRDKDPNGNLGVTTGPAAGDSFDETIELFPGMYSQPNAIDVDTETQALIIQLESSLASDPNLISVATKVYGRLIGETLSHEIGHALLWDDIPADGHNAPAIPNDLMNRGVDRLFGQRTGMENTAQVSPVLPEHYVDHGRATIGGFQAVNQGLINGQWPVPPALG